MTEIGDLPSSRTIRVRGLVQGVGFRPFVWKLAGELGLSGHVLNDGAGVLIEVHGSPKGLDAFVERLRTDKPALARLDAIDVADTGDNDHDRPRPNGFSILESRDGAVRTGVVPDAATCPECLADISDPADRRYRYPFTNCTHCGPRLSILRRIPYDRASTSMAVFEMCAACRDEYGDPSDRRFHAQPTACPDCGPRLWFETTRGEEARGDPVALAADLLKAGGIVAVKGLGGFQIAVDAGNEQAVAELRRRKHRQEKPLALMARDLDQIRRFASVAAGEAELLQSPAAPIVLLGRAGEALAESIAGPFDRLGFMLPNTPLHHLLVADLDRPVVMTSGNLADNPQESENTSARENLGLIVDGFLMHDREIVNRVDDSVVRLDRTGPAILRRARGFAPAPIRLPEELEDAPMVLAMGGELKSAFCLLNGREAILSQHVGDLENAPTLADYKRFLDLFMDLYRFRPEVIAVDGHPDYLSTAHGIALARDTGARLVSVQHHHAHLASCLAEQSVPRDRSDRTFGIILDGLGWAADGTVWGGEVLAGGIDGAERVAHLAQVRLPGGAAAVREPWRNLAAHLFAAFGPDYRDLLAGTGPAEAIGRKKAGLLDRIMESGVNAPLSSSAGRLFDAVAAALGICFDRQGYEGEAGMRLECLARSVLAGERGYPVEVAGSRPLQLAFSPMWQALIADLRAGDPPGRISARFHLGLIEGLAETLVRSGAEPGDRVALSGGVFQNAILRDGLTERLSQKGFQVLNHRQVPANDGGLALGQAVVAAARAQKP
ncbi:MAG: carbamoyltransferase HypF [Roseibium sp.]